MPAIDAAPIQPAPEADIARAVEDLLARFDEAKDPAATASDGAGGDESQPA